MRRVNRVRTVDGRKPIRVSPKRGGSFPVLFAARTSQGLPIISPGYEDSRRRAWGDITVCESRRIAKYGCTGAFILFSSSKNVLLRVLPSASRTGAKPVDLEGNQTFEGPALNPIGSVRRECPGRKRSIERSRGIAWTPGYHRHCARYPSHSRDGRTARPCWH